MATLKVEKREAKGKYAAFKLRQEGYIPGVVYGRGTANTHIKVPLKDFKQLLHSGERLINLDIEGQEQQALLKDVQHGIFEGEVLHADFRVVTKDTKLHVEVPVELAGEAAGKEVGGVVEQALFDVAVECLPGALPEKIVLDISQLAVETVWYVSNLPRPEGVTYTTSETVAVVNCHMPAGAEVEEEEEVVEEPETTAEPEVIGEKERVEKEKEKGG